MSDLFAVFGHSQSQWVFTVGLGCAHYSQDLPQRHAGHLPQHQDPGHQGHAIRNGPGFIEHHHINLREANM